MALRGHVFKKQLFSSECFALFIDTFLGGESGIINGCTLANTTSKITLNKGYFLVKGRFLEEEEGIDFTISSTESGEKFCKLVCEIDLSKENTTSVLNQAYYKIIEDDEDYPELEQDDITTDLTGIYQFEFAEFKRTTAGISNFRDTRQFVDFDSIYSEVRTQINYVLEDSASNFEEWFEGFKSASITSFEDWMETSQSTFDEWFETVQDTLDEDTAGHLLNLINTKANKKKVYTLTLDTTWTGESAPYTKTVSVNGILATDIVNIEPVFSSTLSTRLDERDEYSKISMIESSNGSVTITCDEYKPSMALNVRLEVLY